VLSNPKWQKAALCLNLVGTIVLFYSFQATSSDFKLITTAQHSAFSPDAKRYALCVNDFALIESNGNSDVTMGHKGCPDWVNAKPAAVVSIEHPVFVELGFLILIAGFVLQYFAVPQPETVAHLREQLRIIKLREKAAKKG